MSEVVVGNGGTGLTSYDVGDMLYAIESETLTRLPIGLSGDVLTVVGGVPSWRTPSSGTVTSVSGTVNRITSTGGTTPVIDIAAAYVGQSSITTLGTITTGAWNAATIAIANGGTGESTASSAFNNLSPLTTTGDLLAFSGGNNMRLGIGTTNQILTVIGGFPAWQTGVAGMVTSVSGTANQITSTGSTTPVIAIASTYVGQASITTLGTITTGVWNGTTISAVNGGTGLTTYATGDTLYGSATNTLSRLAIGTANQVLTVIAGVPSWQTPSGGTVTSVSGTANRITSTGGMTPVIDIAATYVGQSSITTLGTITTGVWNGTTIAAVNGGTGLSTYTTGDTLYASATNVLSKLAIGTANQVLTVIGGVPTWQTGVSGTVTSVSGTANRITSTGGTTPVIDISAAYVGQSSITTLGTVTTGTWNAMTITTTHGGTGLTSYNTGDTVYASAANTLSALAIGIAGQVLTVVAGLPSWQTDSHVSSVSGTANRITSTGGTTPVIDISAAYVGQSSITTLGTITTGVWNGTTIAAVNGGTGLSTYTTGDTLYASATNVLSKLAIGTANQVLTVIGGVPTWQTGVSGTVTSVSGTAGRVTSTGGTTPVIDIAAAYVGQSSITTLGTITTGVWTGTTIAIANGGTGATTALTAFNVLSPLTTTGDLLTYSGGNNVRLGIGTVNQVLTVVGGIPAWQTGVSGTVTSVSGTANRTTSTGGTTPVIDISAAYVGQSSITTLGTITTGVWNGTTIAAVNGGTGLSTYTTGDTLYASATNVLSKLAIGTVNQVLTVIGGVPTWQTGVSGTVTSVSGTANRITSTGGTTPVIDISAAYVGQSSITTLGTITTGVWNGTTIAIANGGTGQTTATAAFDAVSPTTTLGDLIYNNGIHNVRLPIGSANQVLTVSGGTVNWVTGVAGTVTSVSGTANQITSSGGTTPVIAIAATYVGQASITTLGTVTTGTWTATTISTTSGGTGLTSYNTGDTLYASSANILSALPIGTTGQVLGVSAGGVPAWQTGTPGGRASTQSTPPNPASTASTTGVMMGLAGTITPISSGKVAIFICGDGTNGSLNDGFQVQIRTGTGTAPANAAALTGTAQGKTIRSINPASLLGITPGTIPFAIQALVSGLTVGTAVWIDLSLASISGGTSSIADITITALEQ